MKDIGSIFPLTNEDMTLMTKGAPLSTKNGNRVNFSLCREAIYAVAKKYDYTKKKVLIPAYTCQTVIDPFIQQGWECYFYNININLRIDLEDLLYKCESFNPTILVVHPYYGVELNKAELEVLKSIKQKGVVLLEDITQCIHTKTRPDVFDYFTGSYRKWYKVPDGGFLESDYLDYISIPDEENTSFVSKQMDAMYLRGKYFDTKDELIKSISIRLNKDAVSEIGRLIQCHKMSDFSMAVMNTEDENKSIEQRFKNYQYLYDNLWQSEQIKFVCNDINEVTTAPLYFPIYVIDRASLQKKLASQHIYAPVLWPVHNDDVLINENIKKIYSTILMIPIDQRYDHKDMIRIVNVING